MDPIHSPIHTPLHVPGVAFIAIPRHALNLLGLLQRNPKLCLFAVAFVGLTDLENLSHLRCGASRSLGVSVSHTQIQATISGPRRHRDLVQVTKSVSAGGPLLSHALPRRHVHAFLKHLSVGSLLGSPRSCPLAARRVLTWGPRAHQLSCSCPLPHPRCPPSMQSSLSIRPNSSSNTHRTPPCQAEGTVPF